jgi:hypothetical protein
MKEDLLGYCLLPTPNSCANVNLTNHKVSFVFLVLLLHLLHVHYSTASSDGKPRWVASRLYSIFKAISYWKEPQTPTPVIPILITPRAICTLLTWMRTRLLWPGASPSSGGCRGGGVVGSAVERTSSGGFVVGGTSSMRRKSVALSSSVARSSCMLFESFLGNFQSYCLTYFFNTH